jgi:hypothetical protein
MWAVSMHHRRRHVWSIVQPFAISLTCQLYNSRAARR